MRAYELYRTNPETLGIYDPDQDHSKPCVTDTRKPQITLRLLNKLKHIHRNRKRENEAKMELVSKMYGDLHFRENELEAQQQATENLKDKIKQSQKSHIADLAMDAVKRQRKG